jgi:hypothetical protein
MTLSCARVRDLAPGFVLAALDADEMAAVRDHLATCDQPHAELTELGGVLPYLAIAPEPLEPPSWLRESVVAAVRAERALRPRPARITALHPEPVEAAGEASAPELHVVPLAGRSRRRSPIVWLSRVAAVVAVVALGGYAVFVQGALDRAKQDRQHAQTALYVAGQQGARTLVLTDEEGLGAGGTVSLLPTGHLVVWLNHLAATHGDEVYTCWITGDNGAQVKAGSFAADGDGTGFLEVDNVPTSASL